MISVASRDGLTTTRVESTRAPHAPLHENAGSENISAGQLRAFVARIERIREEQKSLAEDLKEIYTEVRGDGFDAKALKDIVKLRAQDPDKLAEHEAIVELYKAAMAASQ